MPEAAGATDPPLPKGCIPIGWFLLAVKFVFGLTDQKIDKESLRDAAGGCVGENVIGDHDGFYGTEDMSNIVPLSGGAPVSGRKTVLTFHSGPGPEPYVKFKIYWFHGNEDIEVHATAAMNLHRAHTAAFIRELTGSLGGFPPEDLTGIAVPNIPNPQRALGLTRTHAFFLETNFEAFTGAPVSYVMLSVQPLTLCIWSVLSPFIYEETTPVSWRITHLNNREPSRRFLMALEKLLHCGRCCESSNLHILTRDAVLHIMAKVCEDVREEWVFRAFPEYTRKRKAQAQ